MNYSYVKEKFLEYVNCFDVNNSEIALKIEHSMQTGELANTFAFLLKLNKEETELIKVISILHDIGRFEQLAEYHTYSDYKSVDHGDLGVKILFEDGLIKKFIETRECDEIIYDAIKIHNKYEIPHSIADKNLKFVKLIRDIDKIDIFRVMTTHKVNELKAPMRDVTLKTFYNKKTLLNKDCKNTSDKTINQMALIFDLNFKESIDVLNDNQYYKNFIDSIDVSKKNEEEFNKMKKFVRDNTNLNI